MSAAQHAAAMAVAKRGGLDLEPSRCESVQAFAFRVLDSVSEQVVDHITGRLTDRAQALRYGTTPHGEARSLRWAVADLDSLMKDVSALLALIPDEEERP